MNSFPRIAAACAGCLFLATAGWFLFSGGDSGEEDEPGRTARPSTRARRMAAAPGMADAASSSGVGADSAGNAGGPVLHDPARRPAVGNRGISARPVFLNLMQQAVSDPDPPQRHKKLREALQQMQAQDAPATYRFVRETMAAGGGIYNVDDMWRAFWVQYGKVDVAGALALAEQDTSEYNQKDRVRKHLYSGWGAEQPAEALARLAKDDTLPERGRGIEGLSAVWAETDPEAATAWALANLQGAFQATALGAIQWGALTSKGAHGAVEMFAALPRTPEADAAVGALGVSLSQTPGIEPAERKYAAEVIRDRGLYNDTLLNNVARDLLKSGPVQAAADYMTGFPPPEKNQVFHPLLTVMNQWTQADPIAAGNWVNAQNGKPWFDSAAGGYARAIRNIDPDASAAWLARIRSEEIRGHFR